jgi:hypothetical protein
MRSGPRFIPFTIIGERGHIPEPVRELIAMIPAGRAPLLVEHRGRDRGDCELVCLAFMLSVAAAASRFYWQHLIGETSTAGLHHFIEEDGWVVDGSSGVCRPVWIEPALAYQARLGCCWPAPPASLARFNRVAAVNQARRRSSITSAVAGAEQ